jgi:hypothetical protein
LAGRAFVVAGFGADTFVARFGAAALEVSRPAGARVVVVSA